MTSGDESEDEVSEEEPPEWKVTIEDDEFDRASNDEWRQLQGYVLVDYEDREISGAVILQGTHFNPGRNVWPFKVGRWSGADVARWFSKWTKELEGNREYLVSVKHSDSYLDDDLYQLMAEELSSAPYQLIDVIHTPEEALEQLQQDLGHRYILRQILEKGLDFFQELTGIQVDGEGEDFGDAIVKWMDAHFSSLKPVRSVLPIPEPEEELYRLLGESHWALDAVFRDDADEEERKEVIDEYSLTGPWSRTDGKAAWRWFLKVRP